MASNNFSYIDLGNGRGRLTFLERGTGEYHTDPLCYPTSLEKARNRADELNKSWNEKHDD
jgi:hypothetical protein